MSFSGLAFVPVAFSFTVSFSFVAFALSYGSYVHWCGSSTVARADCRAGRLCCLHSAKRCCCSVVLCDGCPDRCICLICPGKQLQVLL